MGAGNIETPGAQDIYTFTAQAGQIIYFDIQDGSSIERHWTVQGEDGQVVFEDPFWNDPGMRTLTRGGTYTITVNSNQGQGTGSYKFQLVPQQ